MLSEIIIHYIYFDIINNKFVIPLENISGVNNYMTFGVIDDDEFNKIIIKKDDRVLVWV